MSARRLHARVARLEHRFNGHSAHHPDLDRLLRYGASQQISCVKVGRMAINIVQVSVSDEPSLAQYDHAIRQIPQNFRVMCEEKQ